MDQPASRGNTRARPTNDRSTLYEEITSKIIAALEAGRVPWVQPWGSSGVRAPLAMPKNGATRRAYSGINVLILWAAVVEHGFSGQTWLTFKQALGLGGNVRKGERGTAVVYADRFVPDDVRHRAYERGEEPSYSLPQALYRVQRRAMRRSARQHWRSANSGRHQPHPAAGRATDPRNRRRHSDRRRQGLLRRCGRLHPRAAAAGVFRTHQFQPHGDS